MVHIQNTCTPARTHTHIQTRALNLCKLYEDLQTQTEAVKTVKICFSKLRKKQHGRLSPGTRNCSTYCEKTHLADLFNGAAFLSLVIGFKHMKTINGSQGNSIVSLLFTASEQNKGLGLSEETTVEHHCEVTKGLHAQSCHFSDTNNSNNKSEPLRI